MEFIDDIHPAPPPEAPFNMDGLVAPDKLLEPGVYFDLDEDIYHSSFGLSYSGIKDFRVSPFLWWCKSPLNPRQAIALAEVKESDAKSLGKAFDARIICGKEFFASQYATELTHSDYPDSLRTMEDLKEWLEERKLKKTGKTKAELIGRAIEHDPTVQIWDAILDGYTKKNEGKEFLSSDWMEKIEYASAMIERHPELSKAFQGGAPQVSVVWDCPKTGVRCRARFDYLKPKGIFDLKTFEPRGDIPIEQAIGKEIGFRKYYIQACFYVEAAAQIPTLIKAGKAHGTPPAGFLEALVKNRDKAFGWVFQIKGPAPQAFGYILPKESSLWTLGNMECDNAKHSFRAHLDKYGADPWIDPVGFRPLDDSNVPSWTLT